jgi:hypothetical protein
MELDVAGNGNTGQASSRNRTVPTSAIDVLYSLADVITCHFAGTLWLFQPCQTRQGFLFVCKEYE